MFHGFCETKTTNNYKKCILGALFIKHPLLRAFLKLLLMTAADLNTFLLTIYFRLHIPKMFVYRDLPE